MSLELGGEGRNGHCVGIRRKRSLLLREWVYPWACFIETFLILFYACSHLDGYGSGTCIGRSLGPGVLGL